MEALAHPTPGATPMKSDLHDMEVIYQHRTEKAVCVRQYEGADDVWIPLSACEIEAK